MGFSKKHQAEMSKESEGKKWFLAGIAVRAPLKPISTKPREEDDESCSTTPTAREAQIPVKLSCPPPPRKRRPTSSCHFNGVREFFNPPELESVFICHAERANWWVSDLSPPFCFSYKRIFSSSFSFNNWQTETRLRFKSQALSCFVLLFTLFF